MDRSTRLQSARTWLKTYDGKNIAAGYRKHFAVDWPCAFRELEMLNVKIDSAYKDPANEYLLATPSNVKLERVGRGIYGSLMIVFSFNGIQCKFANYSPYCAGATLQTSSDLPLAFAACSG